MEKYKIKSDEEMKPVKFGKFCEMVYEKQKKSYGEVSADETRKRIKHIYQESQKLLSRKEERNLLLVGKVQSGKTSNLEMFTAFAFDNGYNLLIIYGGYDDTLLNQTNTRFKETFEIPISDSLDSPHPAFFSTSKHGSKVDFEYLDDSVIQDMVENNKPIIITAMKRPKALANINSFLKRLKLKNVKTFIIDDEGDQASLNTAKDKENFEESSATYKAICTMKDLLGNPLYLSVTATPQANIFSPTISKLNPLDIKLIDAGNGYCGSAVYHLGDPDLITEIDDFEDEVDGSKMPESMKYAINYYLIAAAIMDEKGIGGADILIHSAREVAIHRRICSFIQTYIDELKNAIKLEQKLDIDNFLKELEFVFYTEFSKTIQKQYNIAALRERIFKVVNKTFVIMKNNPGNASTLPLEQYKPYKIFVGGDLLQRGVTFKNLVVTYFTRWAKSGNMDTTLQRARWFGYREKFIDLCKIFTTNEIQREFTNLADIEIDLWDQFEGIQNGELQIENIIIPAQDSILRPTRSNVATFAKVEFARRWTKQQLGIFDKNTVDKNNKIIREFISNNKFIESNIARTDKESSCSYALVKTADVKKLMDALAQSIFLMQPFSLNAHIIEHLLASQKEIPIILMKGNRERKFDSSNRINNIHQGPDKSEISARKYMGDTEVVIDKDKINIQIHYIVPKKEGAVRAEIGQYMFAIFTPGKQSYYVRGKL